MQRSNESCSNSFWLITRNRVASNTNKEKHKYPENRRIEDKVTLLMGRSHLDDTPEWHRNELAINPEFKLVPATTGGQKCKQDHGVSRRVTYRKTRKVVFACRVRCRPGVHQGCLQFDAPGVRPSWRDASGGSVVVPVDGRHLDLAPRA